MGWDKGCPRVKFLLEAHGPTPFAFTFKTPFEAVIAPWPPASTLTAPAWDTVQGIPRGTI